MQKDTARLHGDTGDRVEAMVYHIGILEKSLTFNFASKE